MDYVSKTRTITLSNIGDTKTFLCDFNSCDKVVKRIIAGYSPLVYGKNDFNYQKHKNELSAMYHMCSHCNTKDLKLFL